MRAAGWGGRDSYGHPYSADTAVYDSFAVQIIAGFWHRGEITVVADIDLFSTYPHGETDVISLFDNLRFARQLFACNTRADSLWLSQTANTIQGRLIGDFTPFEADSSEWKYRFLTSGAVYNYYGWELAAYYDSPDKIVAYYPSLGSPIADSAEVCLNFLPDYNGETVLWDFPVCDTFWFDYDGISETHIPGEFSLSIRPNPFNSAVRIAVDAPGKFNTPLQIEIFDINGRMVEDMTVGSRHASTAGDAGVALTKAIWQPDKSIGSGVYLIRARFGDGSVATKMVVYLK